jgi:hypothetical protein
VYADGIINCVHSLFYADGLMSYADSLLYADDLIKINGYLLSRLRG